MPSSYYPTNPYHYARRRRPWLQRGLRDWGRALRDALRGNKNLRQGLGGILFVLLALGFVPWQADEAASIKLAAIFKNESALSPAVATLTEIAMAEESPAAPATATANLQPSSPPQPAADATPNAAPTAAPPTVAGTAAAIVEEKTLALRAGQNIQNLLQAAGAVGQEAAALSRELKSVFDLRRLKAGQEITIRVKRDGDIVQLLGLSFEASNTRQITVERDKNGSFDAKALNVPTTLQRLVASGQVQSSLYDAAQNAGMPRRVMTDVMRIFAHKIDFQRDIKKGDKFNVLYEQNVTAKGDKVGDGQVIFAAIESGGEVKRLYRYEYAKGQFDYFDEQGRTAKRGLLRTPISAARVTSGFGMRRHPILGYSKMHEGVDFAAPVGTPIYAAGDGTIVRIGFFGAYGRYIQIRHNNRLQTAYAHMSRFADKLKVGDRVRQGQIIAYVGSSGRSTGPHLHYEVIIDGRKVNPMSVDVPTGRSLNQKEMNAFKAWRERLHAEFQALNQGLPANSQLANYTKKR